MFVTNENHKHPLSAAICRNGLELWNAVEVELFRPWFLIEVDQPAGNDELRLTRTMLISCVEDVLSLATPDQRSPGSLKSVALMSPSTKENAGSWSMHPLTEIWEADEPQDSRLKAKIFAKACGGYYVESIFGTTVDMLHDWHQLLALPIKGNASDSAE